MTNHPLRFVAKSLLMIGSSLLVSYAVTSELQAQTLRPEQLRHTITCARAKTCPCPTEKVTDIDFKKCATGDNDCVNRTYNLKLLIDEYNNLVIACRGGRRN